MISLARNLLPKISKLDQSKNYKLVSKFHSASKFLNSTSLANVSANKQNHGIDSNNKSVVNPLKYEDFFQLKELVNLENLFK